MSHRLALLLAAGLALGVAACDNPAAGILSTAKTGDCFTVTGKDAVGQPKLMRSDCPVGQTPGQSSLPSASTDQASAPANASVASAQGSTPAAASAPLCQPALPACVVPAANVVAQGKGHWRRVTRKVRRQGHVVSEMVDEYVPQSGEVLLPGESAYVAPDTEIAGGVASQDTYQRRDEYAYAPPPPLPPPPPPVARAYADRSLQVQSRSSQSYSVESRSSDTRAYATSAPPPPQPRPCNCAAKPHYEPDGYLTWPGKSPY